LVGIGFAAVPVMNFMGIIGVGKATTDTVTQEPPNVSLGSVIMDDDMIDLNSDGTGDKIEIKIAENNATEAVIAVIDGKTDTEIWSGSMPISKDERCAYYFSNCIDGQDRLIFWSYSLTDGKLVYRCVMFNFDENNQRRILADTEHTFDFSDGHSPYEYEEERWAMLLKNLNKNLNASTVKGYLLVDNTGDEIEVWVPVKLMRKSDIRYTLSELIDKISN